MLPVANDWFQKKPVNYSSKQINKKIKRDQLSKRSRSRKETSLLPVIKKSTLIVVNGLTDSFIHGYVPPERRRQNRRLHAEKMKLLHVQLPRLMERIEKSRDERILKKAKDLQKNIYQILKILMKRSRALKFLQARRNNDRVKSLFPCWWNGFKTRRLIKTIQGILYKPLIAELFTYWRSSQRQQRLRFKYNYVWVRKNTLFWLLKTVLRKWKEYTLSLQKLRKVYRNIALKNSNIRACLNSWKLHTCQRKELKSRVRRKMMGLKQAALHAWYDLTKYLVDHRLRLYLKFSKRMRFRKLIPPFQTLYVYRLQSISAKRIQTKVRSCFSKRRVQVKRNKLLQTEIERQQKENEYVKRIIERIDTKISKDRVKEAKKIIVQHRQMIKMRQKNLAKNLPDTPRSKLLRPLFATFDIDNRNTIDISYLGRIKYELGLSKSCKISLLPANRLTKIKNEELKDLLKGTSFDSSFIVMLKRKWRQITGATLNSAVIGILKRMQLERIQKIGRIDYRTKYLSAPLIQCSACSSGFVLWRDLLHHQKVCEEMIWTTKNKDQTNVLTLRKKLSNI
jgi:hypothetical protein